MSDAAGWPRVKDVFQAALDRPPEERAAFLDTACAGDDALRREVQSLLDAQREAGAFLSRPAALPAPPELEGRRIGPYRILGAIGQGGMGVVYRAVRDDDVFRKTVAVKVVPGGAGAEHLRRLERERQILARLQHPNIATILDGGATDDGQPYLVMEYVDGEAIDAYCAGRGLGTRERLEMFKTVCLAVHYAHQNLVVHRDLKPQNILVTPEGQPKLLDFGIAKLLAAGVDPDEAPTATMLPMMTPEYASPEQVRGQPVTTASDVYSLGILLYELLTGSRPYSVSTGSLEDIVRTICGTEPRLPSLAATRRAVELRGDLDTIVLKALRKEPERRYLSAQEMAEDIRRYLAGLPVLARKDTVRYRMGKFVGRHRVGVGASALVLASLVGGMAMTVREARIADAHRRRAERRFDEVRRLAGFVMFDMHDAIERLPGSTPARKQLVEKALEYLDGLASDASGDAVLKAEIARGYERLAQIQGQRGWANLADAAGALASVRKALPLREQLAVQEPGDAGRSTALARSYGLLAELLRQQGQSTEAAGAREKMRSILDALSARRADDPAVLKAWALYYDSTADVHIAAGDLVAAREARRRHVEVAEKLVAQDPANLDQQRDLAVACKYYGAILHRFGERKLAREQYDKALALDRKAAAAEPLNPHRKLDLSFSEASIGSLLRDEGDLDGALGAYRRALALREEVFAADPDNQFAYSSLVRGHQSLAGVFALQADLDMAVAEERAVLRLREQWEGKHPTPYGRAARDAALSQSIGDHNATIAALPQAPAARRKAGWLRAREEYSRALAAWHALAAGRALEGEYAEVPHKLEEAIARCDEALKKLGARS